MVSTLTKNAIDLIINNNNDPNEEYIIQVLVAPTFVAESVYKFTISDGFSRTKKGYLVGEAATRSQDIKDLSIIRVRKFLKGGSEIDDRAIFSQFEVLYQNVTEMIGKPIEYKQYKSNGFQNPDGSINIPEKYASRNAQQAQRNVAAAAQPRFQQQQQQQQLPNNQFNNQNKPAVTPQTNNAYGHNRVTQNPSQMYGQNANNNNNTKSVSGFIPTANQQDEKDLERISQLTVNNNESSFKARVTKKGEMKSFKSQRGDGTLFSIDVIDNYGDQVSISFFNQEAQKFFSYIQVGQIYIFKNGIIKQNTNRQYNKGEVQISIGKETEIKAVQDDGRIPQMHMNRVFVRDVQNLDKDKIVDLIGFVRQNTESRIITLKDQTQKARRDIKVFDESREEIEVALWGDKAENTNAREGDMILFKDAKIGEYNQKKQININYGTQVILNPDLQKFPDAQVLSEWREKTDLGDLLETLQNQSSSNYEGGEKPVGIDVPVRSLESSITQLQEEIDIARQNGDYAKQDFKIWKEVRAIIHYIKDTPFFYESCDSCKRKIQPDGDKWYCSFCKKTYDEPKARYIISAKIADSTNEMFVSIFDEVGIQIFNGEANQFRQLGDNIDERRRRIQAFYNKEYRFLLLSKFEKDQNGELRDKTVVHKIKDNQPIFESKRILNALEKYLESD